MLPAGDLEVHAILPHPGRQATRLGMQHVHVDSGYRATDSSCPHCTLVVQPATRQPVPPSQPGLTSLWRKPVTVGWITGSLCKSARPSPERRLFRANAVTQGKAAHR